MLGILTDSDREFIEQFERRGLGKSCWTHTAHVRMAWIQLVRAPSFDEALDKIRLGIQTFNASVGSTGYHETVTVAYAICIEARIERLQDAHTFEVFLEKNQDLLAKSPPFLGIHYSPEVLAEKRAFDTFVEPDRKPLPGGSRIGVSNLFRP